MKACARRSSRVIVLICSSSWSFLRSQIMSSSRSTSRQWSPFLIYKITDGMASTVKRSLRAIIHLDEDAPTHSQHVGILRADQHQSFVSRIQPIFLINRDCMVAGHPSPPSILLVASSILILHYQWTLNRRLSSKIAKISTIAVVASSCILMVRTNTRCQPRCKIRQRQGGRLGRYRQCCLVCLCR